MNQTVYEVDKWSERFETAESRKYKRLTWISERIDFNSTFWQKGLDTFGPEEWPRVYGNWMIILKTVADAKVRGRLSGEHGEAWTASRIARPSGCDSKQLQIAFDFAVSVGALRPAMMPPGESPGNLPEPQEKTNATERNGTLLNETKRNGTEPENAAGPVRSGEVENSKRKTPADNPTDRPASELLHERAKRLPLLQKLERLQMIGSGINWHGSVFSQDRLKPAHVMEADTAFWVKWYADQLSATNPVFRCGNHAELCYILAAVAAVRRCTEANLKGTKRIARLIHWLKNRECSSITDADFARAAEAIARHFGTKQAPQTPAAVDQSMPPTGINRYKPSKEKSAAALQRIRENRSKVPGAN